MYILEVCNNLSTLGVILLIKKIIKIISIVVPILLVLLVSIDFSKAVVAGNEQDMKKAQNLAIKRIIIAIVLFFVPIIIDTSFSLTDKTKGWTSCYNNATESVVNALTQADKEKLIKKESDRQALIKAAKKSIAAEKKEIEKLRKRAKNLAKTINEQAGGSAYVSSEYVQAKRIAEAADTGPCRDTGSAYDCTLGDQSGNEVRFSSWRKGWDTILRLDDPVKANTAALCMENAVNNDNIGYGRTGYSSWSNLWRYLEKKKNWDTSKANVTEKTSVSCCPLVGVCLKYAGYKVPPKGGLGCVCNNWEKQKSVKELGNFTEIKSRNLKDIKRGDILIKNCNHMAMAV